MSDPRRRIPGVDRLLEAPAFRSLRERYGPERLVPRIRAAVERVRNRLEGGQKLDDPGDPELYAREVEGELRAADRPSLRPVVNGTGVVLHTNLGRAPLAEEAREAMRRVAEGYANLEYDLEAGERGSRYDHCVDLLTELTGAEDALVVNNNAAALVLALNTIASGRGVVVSRGELVEIGGGFRIPEILGRAGAELREVGSTNRTRPEDYRRAVDEGDAALLLKVHRSNFRISGFTEEASLEELVEVGGELGLPVLHDLGSGLLIDPSELGLPPEPRPQESLEAGADLVIVSGDKLLGGPQAGIVLGRRSWIERLRRNPLCRAVRVDKTILAALETTLRFYRDPAEAKARIPALRMLAASTGALEARTERLVAALTERGIEAAGEACSSVVGGGTYPGLEIESRGVAIPMEGSRAIEAARALRGGETPVVVRVDDRGLHLDLRTVLEEEEDRLVEALATVLAGEGA